MKRALLAAVALAATSAPVWAQACGDEGRYFHLKPPSYTISSARRQAIHRWAKAIRWYKEHLGDKPLCAPDQGYGWNAKPQ